MTVRTIRAVYHAGAFHPVNPIEIPLQEGQSAEIIIETTEDDSLARVERILALVQDFYDDLPQEEIDAMEEAMRRRPDFFGESDRHDDHSNGRAG